MRVAALVAAMLSFGCATIVAGGPDDIPITTNPPGAYVYLDGKVVGQTPLVVTLERDKSLGDIRIFYPGFQTVAIQRYKHINWWIVGNFFLAMFPVIVDFVTGNWQAFDDDSISLSLVPGDTPPPYGIQPGGAGQPGPRPIAPRPPPPPPPQEPRPPGPVL